MLSIGPETMLTKRTFIHWFETFSNQRLWEIYEIAKKINEIYALSKKRSFQ